MDYEVVGSPTYPTPNYAQFGETIGNLANTYRSGQQQNMQIDQEKAFQQGIPLDANGQPDYAAIMRILAQKGDIGAISQLAPMVQQQQQLTAAQTQSPMLAPDSAPAPVMAPSPMPSPASSQPPGDLPPASAAMAAPTGAKPVTNLPAPGRTPVGDLSGAVAAFPSVDKLVSSSVQDPAKAPVVATNLARALKVDPNAPLTQDQAVKAQSILAAYVKRNVAPGNSDATLGQRNNNPDNIENGGFAASQPGYAGLGQGGRFASFATPEAGLDAASNLLGVYGRKGINTIAGITATWAPASEKGNNPLAYAAAVSKELGVDSNQPLDLSKPDARRAIAAAMAKVESRMSFPPTGGAPQSASAAPGAPAGQPQGPRPIGPQVPLPKGFTDPQQAIQAIDQKIMELASKGNPYLKPQIDYWTDYKNRIADSAKLLEVRPGETLLDPRTGQVAFQGAMTNANNIALQRFLEDKPDATPQEIQAFIQSGKSSRSAASAYINKFMQENPNATADDVAKAAQGYTAKVSGLRLLEQRTASLDLAEDESKTLIPRVLTASANVPRTKYPDLNAIIMAAKLGTGDPNVVKLGVAVGSLTYVYARVLSPTGQLNESDRQNAQALLSKAWSEGQIEAALDQMRLEIDSARKGLTQAKKDYAEEGIESDASVPPAQVAPTPAAAAPAASQAKPDKDGWVTLPNGVRIREAQ